MSEKIYPQGIRTFAPRKGAPDFVLGTCIITPAEFVEWVKENKQYLTSYNGKQQIKFNLLTKKDGGVTFTVDTYQPEAKEPITDKQPEPAIFGDDDIPF